MSQEFVIQAFPRDDKGKGASRRLRREERKIPAIIYGGGQDATPVAIWHNELKKALENEAFFSHILTIDLEGKKESVILKDLQRHPYKPILTHADFQRVDKDHEIHVNVPLHFLISFGPDYPSSAPNVGFSTSFPSAPTALPTLHARNVALVDACTLACWMLCSASFTDEVPSEGGIVELPAARCAAPHATHPSEMWSARHA